MRTKIYKIGREYYLWFPSKRKYFVYCYHTQVFAFYVQENLQHGMIPADYQLRSHAKYKECILVRK